MYREDSLDADTVGNSANGEGLGNARTLAGNNGSFESLNSFSLALADLNGNLYGVAELDLGDLVANLKRILCNNFECVHFLFFR